MMVLEKQQTIYSSNLNAVFLTYQFLSRNEIYPLNFETIQLSGKQRKKSG
tara:strand:- start:314 stop:463 length:150 start_codon:yes stop_codon:yes gene_type:complete